LTSTWFYRRGHIRKRRGLSIVDTQNWQKPTQAGNNNTMLVAHDFPSWCASSLL
jgi:hypothetical protein